MRKTFALVGSFFAAILFVASLDFSVAAEGGIGPGETIDLLKSGNLDDWDFFLADPNLVKSDVWSFRDGGILYCKGQPFGWLATKENYKNLRFTGQYRWPEGEKATNSGIFLRIVGPGATLPCCVECQLMAGKAGDLYGFNGKRIVGSPDRSKEGNFFGVSRFAGNEKPEHEWNDLEIVAQNGVIIVVMNGQLVNWTLDADQTPGKLGLQSEGGPIEFRNCFLTPLP